MATLEYEKDRRWKFCILHALVLFHSLTLISSISSGPVWKTLQATVKCSVEPHIDRNGKSLDGNNLSSKLWSSRRSTNSLWTGLANVWFHAVRPVIDLFCLCLSLSIFIDWDATPSYQIHGDSSFSTKWDHTIEGCVLFSSGPTT